MFDQDNWIVIQLTNAVWMNLIQFVRNSLHLNLFFPTTYWKKTLSKTMPKQCDNIDSGNARTFQNGKEETLMGTLYVFHPCLTWKVSFYDVNVCGYQGSRRANEELCNETEATCCGCVWGPLPFCECSSVVV